MSLTNPGNQKLIEIARRLRISIIEMLFEAGSGHSGGSLSCVEILTSLFFHHLQVAPHDPLDPKRDRFVLSKGHAAPTLYATLAELGYFPHSWLKQLRKLNSPLQGHPDMRRVPGIEVSTGSLGQGLSIGVGMALADVLDNNPRRVVVLMGDGEIQEGMVWEAAMAASHHKLANLLGIIDLNGLQIDGQVKEVMSIEPVKEKWEGFGWQVTSADGHDIESLIQAYEWAATIKDQPCLVIAKTIKGKGISFMENQVNYHGVAPSEEEKNKALAELRA